MSDSRDPSKPFWAVFSIGNLDGTYDMQITGAYDTEVDAMARMQAEIDDIDPLQHVMFRCTPIARHVKQPMRLKKFRATGGTP